MQDIRFKTFTGQVFELPANPAQTIGDLIVTIQETINDPNYTNIKLIYNGNTLDPSDSVSSIGIIADDEYILVKNSNRRSKAKKENTPAPEEKKTTFAEEKEQSAPSSVSGQRRKKHSLPRRTDLEIPKEDPPDFEQKVQSLMELGTEDKPFKREDVEKALRVSFFNPDRASLYLFSGNIPDCPAPEVNMSLRKPNNNNDINQDSNQIEKQLTEEQYALIALLMSDTGKDYGTVLQTAYACNFNENDLRNLLQD